MEKNEKLSDESYYWIKIDSNDLLSNEPNSNLTSYAQNNLNGLIFYLNNPKPIKKVKEIDDKTVALSIPLNDSGFKNMVRSYRKKDLIKSQIESDINLIKNLSSLVTLTFDEAVYYLACNTLYFKASFNYVSDDVAIISSEGEKVENLFRKLSEEYGNSILENPESVIIVTELKSEIENLINQNYSESYENNQIGFLRFVRKFLEKDNIVSKNNNLSCTNFNMLSNCFYNSNKDYNNFENLKCLIKTFSMFSNYQNKTKSPSINFDYLYCGLKLLEIFGCSNFNMSDDNFIPCPQFNTMIYLNINKKNFKCEKAKIKIISFNKSHLENIFKNNESNAIFRNFNIFHIFQKFVSSNSQNIDFHLETIKSESLKKWLSINYLANEKFDYDLLINLVSLLKIFKFSKEDIQLVLKFILLVFLFTDIKFEQDKSNKIIIKNENEFFDCLKQIYKIDTEAEENIKKVFFVNCKENSFQNKNIFKSVEECVENLESIRNNIYERLFHFVVYKINNIISIEGRDLSLSTKELIITNFEGAKIKDDYIDNIFDIFNLYFVENSLNNFEKSKIHNLYEEGKNDGVKNLKKDENTISYQLHKKNSENIENIFKFSSDQSLGKEKKLLKIKLDKNRDVTLSIEEILKQNFKNNDNTIQFLNCLQINDKEILKPSNFTNYSDENFEIIREYNNNFNVLGSEKHFLFNFSEIFKKSKKNIVYKVSETLVIKISKALSNTSINFYLENPMLLFSNKFSYKEFYEKFVEFKNKMFDSLDLTELEFFLKSNNIEKSEYVLGDANVYIKNTAMTKLNSLDRKNSDHLTTENDEELVPSIWVDNLFENISKKLNLRGSLKKEEKKKEIELEIVKSDKANSDLKETFMINQESMSFLTNNPPEIVDIIRNDSALSSEIEFRSSFYSEREDMIFRIQSAWRSRKMRRHYFNLKEKVFILQRNIRKLIQKKYNLPHNYYYNEKFLRAQHEKYEKNLLENLSIIFPAIFEEKPFSSTNRNGLNSSSKAQNSNGICQSSPYEKDKIHLFSKILDFDMMIETDEVYENLWAKSYDSIYTTCLKNNSPVQLIGLGSSHTVCVNSKGKVYSFGWNNYGQCGLPVNSTIISRENINSEFLVEMNEYSELRPRVLNMVEGIKLPQIEEFIFTKAIACGEDHTLLLDHNGSLWGYGLNLNGQLGLGHQKFVERPTKLENLSKHTIISVKSEGDINFAINDKGESFMWPSSDKNGEINFNPIKLSLRSPKEKVASIACGNNFVLILNNNGMVFSMGKSNNYGQLGHGDTNPRYRPTLIEYFQMNNERISQISCGYKHCVAKSLIGHAFTWGLGVKGQLGQNNFNNYSLPYQVKIEGQPITKIHQVSAGFRSTYFLIENRRIYFSGCNGSNALQSYPIPFLIWEKIPEFSNESDFSVVRIMNTWNKSFSIFYATIADTTTVKSMNLHKLNQILLNLNNKWDSDSIEVPYIESIAKYFTGSTMKLSKELKIPNK